MRHLAINPEVHKALKANFELFLVFSRFAGPIDSDIDPIHNPDWCKSRSEREAQWLIEAQDQLDDLRHVHSRAL